VPEGLWTKCPECNAVLYKSELERNIEVCPKCGFHERIGAREVLNYFLDAQNREEIAAEVEPVDILRFRDTKKYKDRLLAAQKQIGEKDSVVTMKGKLLGDPVVVSVFNFLFIGGSMGAVAGERFVRGVEAAIHDHIPFICFSASGGARMQ